MNARSSSAHPADNGHGWTPPSGAASITAHTVDRERPPARSRNERGQAAVEFALVVPVFCLIVLALVDFGEGAELLAGHEPPRDEGARLAAVLGNSPEPGGGWKAWIQQQAETGGAAQRDGLGHRRRRQVCIRLPGEPTGRRAKIGDPVRVTVSADYKWIPFVGGATIKLASHSTMRLERLPTYSARRMLMRASHSARVRRDGGVRSSRRCSCRRCSSCCCSSSTSATGTCTSGTSRCRSTRRRSRAVRTSATASRRIRRRSPAPNPAIKNAATEYAGNAASTYNCQVGGGSRPRHDPLQQQDLRRRQLRRLDDVDIERAVPDAASHVRRQADRGRRAVHPRRPWSTPSSPAGRASYRRSTRAPGCSSRRRRSSRARSHSPCRTSTRSTSR